MTARYIARNPVEAGLCRVAREWAWSSHAGLLEGTAPPWVDGERLLAYFASAGGEARLRYLDLVDDGS